VQQHFTRTSDLFQHMTTQYRELYDHLAQGAQSLCDTIPATPELDLSERELLPRREEARDAAPTSRSLTSVNANCSPAARRPGMPRQPPPWVRLPLPATRTSQHPFPTEKAGGQRAPRNG
jgi:hypothetical protein